MAESRDRITRPVDIAEVFAQRRSGPLGILSDEAMEVLGSPARQSVTRSPMGSGVGATVSTARGGGFRRDSSFGTPRVGIRGGGRNLYRSTGRENVPVTVSPLGRGRGGGTRSVLPSWYPRTPLRDITAVVRVIERRARLGDGEGLIVGTPTTHNEAVLGANVSSSVAQLEHNLSTPASTTRLKKPCPPSLNVSKILLSVTNRNEESAEELLTPQKKLLNSIDTVGKAVMEELEKLKKTPSAKKAQRQYKVRTLMSMR